LLSQEALPKPPDKRLSDWSLATTAELFLAVAEETRKQKKGAPQREYWALAWATLEQALNSPTASPMLWYEDIFLDVGQHLRFQGEPRAVEFLKRVLAHNQLENSLGRLAQSERRGREAKVSPAVLADLRAALNLDLNAGARRPIAELCRELVPDLDQVPVKRPWEKPDLPPPGQPAQRQTTPPPGQKPGRNDPCWCGSGKKYKHCHRHTDQRR
jgi:hypothetical protein